LRKFAKVFSLFIGTIWGFFPKEINILFGNFLAFLWFDLFRIRRQVILDNIGIAFPQKSHAEKVAIGRESMQVLCRSFFDVMLIPSLNDVWVQKNVVFEGREIVDRYSDKGGVLFLTLHMGSGDLAAAAISQSVIPCSLISKRFRSSFLDEFWFSLRGRAKTEFIDAHSQRNAFEILSALKKRRGVVFVLDQFMGKPYGVETEFFGRKTGTAYGLALFAKKTERPVIPVYTYWGEKGQLHIKFSEPIATTPDLSETNEEMTNKFNRALEKIIMQHPGGWMWVHRRWKTFE
jgi:Kdo2-lipid IVA lauroyltransferase/acyltransferase